MAPPALIALLPDVPEGLPERVPVARGGYRHGGGERRAPAGVHRAVPGAVVPGLIEVAVKRVPEHELLLSPGDDGYGDTRTRATGTSPPVRRGQITRPAPPSVGPGLVDVVVGALPIDILVPRRIHADRWPGSGGPAGSQRPVPASVVPGLIDPPVGTTPEGIHPAVTRVGGGGYSRARLPVASPAGASGQVTRPAPPTVKGGVVQVVVGGLPEHSLTVGPGQRNAGRRRRVPAGVQRPVPGAVEPGFVHVAAGIAPEHVPVIAERVRGRGQRGGRGRRRPPPEAVRPRRRSAPRRERAGAAGPRRAPEQTTATVRRTPQQRRRRTSQRRRCPRPRLNGEICMKTFACRAPSRQRDAIGW